MKSFMVYRYEIIGKRAETPINSDNTDAGVGIRDERTDKWLVGFNVYEYDDETMEQVKKTYYIDRGRPGADPDSVIEQIKKDHPAGEWENYNW